LEKFVSSLGIIFGPKVERLTADDKCALIIL
jgi:hypothetical protein